MTAKRKADVNVNVNLNVNLHSSDLGDKCDIHTQHHSVTLYAPLLPLADGGIKNIRCGYSIGAPLRGTSNEYITYDFVEKKKISTISGLKKHFIWRYENMTQNFNPLYTE